MHAASCLLSPVFCLKQKSITTAFKSYLLSAHCNALTTTGYLLNSSLKLLTGIGTAMLRGRLRPFNNLVILFFKA
jgi:hypothetical protein